MNVSAKGPGKKARIEIIPLIDIMFFLLASFMLVSMSMIKLQKIDTKLPSKAKAPPPSEKQDMTVLAIDATNNVYYDRDQAPIGIDAIAARLAETYKIQRENTKVLINCDKDAKYDSLIAVLDLVRSLGITKVSFPIKMDNIFDPTKPRPDTHVPAPGAAPAAPAAPAPATPPANP